MSKSGEKNDSVGSGESVGADVESKDGVRLELDFAPSWARTSPEEHIKKARSNRFDDEGGSFRGAGNRPPKRGGWRDGGGSGERFQRRDRDDAKGDRKPRRRDDGTDGVKKFNRDVPAGAPAAQSAEGLRRNEPHRPARDFHGHPRVEQPSLPLEIRILPEQKALGAVIRRIQSSHRAFPLRDIAWLFLDKPASCLVRIAQNKDAGEPLPLFQCKACGVPVLSEEEVQSHLLNRHLEDFFLVEEVECEPPGGQFVCVMRCGITGELLGPPNHHSYNTKVQEMLRTKFPNMSEEAYRRKIESVRDPELIESWRQSCTRKKIYRRKTVEKLVVDGETPVAGNDAPPPSSGNAPAADQGDAPERVEGAAVGAGEAAATPSNGSAAEISGVTEAAVTSAEDQVILAPPMERDVAELVFRREIMPGQYAAVKHLVCVASIALQTPSKQLFFAVRDMIHREKRFPTSLFFALRGAFRHRKLYLFRAKEPRGPDFVMQKKPAELDPSHTVALIKEILAFLHDHPACTKVELVQALTGGATDKIKETLGQLAWLIEKGNVIEYYNDVLSAPTEYPAFRLLDSEKKRTKPGEAFAAATVAEESGAVDSGKPAESVEPAAAEAVEPAEPVEPAAVAATEPAEPVEPAVVAAAEPAESVEPAAAEAVEPAESVEPAAAEAVEPAEPVEPAAAAAAEPAESVEPAAAEAVEPAEPVEPAAVAATEPAESVEPAAAEAVEPAEPVEPAAVAATEPKES